MSSLENLCRRVIFGQKPTIFTSVRIVASFGKRGNDKKTSLRKLACFKNRIAPKMIKFSKKYEGFQKKKIIKKYLKLSKYFKKVRKYLKSYVKYLKKVRCIENKSVRKSKQVS